MVPSDRKGPSMRTIHSDVSAVSRTLGIPRADLAGTRTIHSEVMLYLATGGDLVAALTLPVKPLGLDLEPNQIAVRAYGDHRFLPRTLKASGIAEPVHLLENGGSPVVIMALAPCLLERLPATAAGLAAA